MGTVWELNCDGGAFDVAFDICRGLCNQNSGFSQMHKIGNIGIIANFVLPYISY